MRAAPRPETMAVLAGAALTGLAAAAAGGMEAKYKIACVLAVAGFAVLMARPERRIACVVLWVLIHPFSVEKVFFVDAAEGPQFMDPTIAINASDGPLLLLAVFLIAETVATGRSAFRWSRLTTIMALFLGWSAISFAVHGQILHDGFVTSGPLTLLQDTRLLAFVLLIQSGIRTRGDVITALAAVAAAILVQTGFVGLSYLTGDLINYATAVNTGGEGKAGGLMGFETAEGTAAIRATGTVGQTNEQAMFHTFMTIPLIGFFAARPGVARLSLAIVAASALAIVLTFSRGAWVSFPFGLGIAATIAWRRGLLARRTVIAAAASGVMAASAGAIFLANPIYERLAHGDSGATESRLRMLRLSVDLFRSDPVFGVGPGEFVEAALALYPPGFAAPAWQAPGIRMPLPGPVIGRVDIVQGQLNGETLTRPLPVHNKYMLTVSELGLPGLALWVWFYAAFVQAAWRCSRRPDRLLSLVGIAGVGVAGAEVLYQMLDLFHEDKPLEIMLFVPALMAAASTCAVARAPAGAVRVASPRLRAA